MCIYICMCVHTYMILHMRLHTYIQYMYMHYNFKYEHKQSIEDGRILVARNQQTCKTLSSKCEMAFMSLPEKYARNGMGNPYCRHIQAHTQFMWELTWHISAPDEVQHTVLQTGSLSRSSIH